MITNQKAHFLRPLILTFFLLFSITTKGKNVEFILKESDVKKDEIKTLANIVYSSVLKGLVNNNEFEITGLILNNSTVTKAPIKYLLPDEDNVREEEVSIGHKFPSETLLTAPEFTEIIVRTPSGHIGHLSPGAKFYVSKDAGDEIKVMKGKVTFSKVDSKESNKSQKKKRGMWDRFKNYVSETFDFFGGRDDDIQAAVEGTEFTIEVNGDDLIINRESGIVAINKREKVTLDEKIIEKDTLPYPPLFVTKTTMRLDIDNKLFTNETKSLQNKEELDSLQEFNLKTEQQINQFFKDQYPIQKYILTKGGPVSKKAFKLMEQGQDTLGRAMYKEAILQGEISSEKFVQASLILVEYYFRNNILKNRDLWLESALRFIEARHINNEKKFLHFEVAGEEEARIGFGNDLVTSKEYYAWAYAVKLKLNGCIENPQQNPRIWMNDAITLRQNLGIKNNQ